MAVYNISYPVNERNPEGTPLPTQEKFHKSQAKYRLLAGGFATGKTTTLCLEILKELFRFKNNYGVLGRKDLSELRSTTLKEFLDICPSELIVSHNKSDHFIKFVNGSELFYMNLDDSREAVEKIKSLNLGFVAIDQLEEISFDVFLAFQGRLRRHESNRNFFATCNPAGHDWVWDRWKNQKLDGYELFEAITLENKYLPEDYVKELLGYPEKWVKRFVYCSWDEFEGLVYNHFVESKHKIQPYQPLDSESHYVILDYGYRNPTAVLFASVDYDGDVRIWDEYYEPGKLVSEIAEEVKQRIGNRQATYLIDPSTRNTQRDGKSVIDEFVDNGLYFMPADNTVIQGINNVNEYFKDDRLLICENCVNTLREIGNYKWKEIKPGAERNEHEEPVKKNDHTMDALRYLINYIYEPYAERSKYEVKSERQQAVEMSQEDEEGWASY